MYKSDLILICFPIVYILLWFYALFTLVIPMLSIPILDILSLSIIQLIGLALFFTLGIIVLLISIFAITVVVTE